MKPIHLLLVEDSEDDMQLMLLFLKQGGYEPLYTRVETDAEFRAELQRQPWDLIICDYNLPRFTGMKALGIVQELGLDIPFILVSGAIGEETAVQALQAGAHDYLLKDKLTRLSSAVGRALRDYQERQMIRQAEAEKLALQEELQLAKEVAEAANQRKSQVLAFVAHEFKNPLNAITVFGEILTKGSVGPLNDTQRDYIQHIMTGAEHLRTLIQDILDIATIEAGKTRLALETISLSPVLDEVMILLKPFAQKKNITLNAHLAPDLLDISAEPKRLRQILLNLMSNAIKYTESGGQVDVTMRHSDDREWLICEVRDNGVGISAEELSQLFVEFYRVNNKLSPQTEGLGLGLALTKRLIELHGGTIFVESTLGVGSIFRFQLPCNPQLDETPEFPTEPLFA